VETAKDFSPIAGHPPAVEVDFRRARPLVVIGGYLVTALAIAWILTLQLPKVFPSWLPQRLAGLGYVQDIQGRVDSAVLQTHNGVPSKGGPLCAFIGFSGGQEGIDIQQLAADDQCDVRYLGLCGASDATITGLQGLSAPLFDSELDVDVVVMAVSPFHLVVRPFQPSLDRSAIKYNADLRLLKSRRRLLAAMGIDSDPRYRNVDPWRPMQKQYFGVVSDRVMQLRIDDYRQRGYFDLSRYDAGGEQGEALRVLVRRTRDCGAEPVILLMPTHPALMQLLPAGATALMRDCVGGLGVTILDMQAAIPLAGFHDGSHLNTEGRQKFTALLADALPELFCDLQLNDAFDAASL